MYFFPTAEVILFLFIFFAHNLKGQRKVERNKTEQQKNPTSDPMVSCFVLICVEDFPEQFDGTISAMGAQWQHAWQ